jgi:CheY-like chemotaxis protein
MADILIVEDDAALQEAYHFILKRGGHAVRSAYNGSEGLERVQRHSFDIILLDIHMPVMNGIEFLRTYQPTKPPGTRIIVFSNMMDSDTEQLVTRLGAYQCILKSSMTPAQMLQLIETVAGE